MSNTFRSTPRTRVNSDASCGQNRVNIIMRHRAITINTASVHAQGPKISSTLDVKGLLLAEDGHIHGSYDIKIFETRCRYVSCYYHMRQHDGWLLGMAEHHEVIHQETSA
ncbi:hypothetical protein DPSP01_001332 [Paraphaeosphaeria sporulosa]